MQRLVQSAQKAFSEERQRDKAADAASRRAVLDLFPVLCADENDRHLGISLADITSDIIDTLVAAQIISYDHGVNGLAADVCICDRLQYRRGTLHDLAGDPCFAQVFAVGSLQFRIRFQHQQPLVLQRVDPQILLLCLQRDPDLNKRSPADFAVYVDRALHGIDQFLDDAHSKTGALDSGNRAGAHSLKRLENTLQEIVTHSDSVILAGKNEVIIICILILEMISSAFFLGKHYFDQAAVVRIFNGVADDIDKDLPEPQDVAVQNFCMDIFHRKAESMPFFLRLRLYDDQQVMQQITQREYFICDRKLSGVNPRHIQHVIDQAEKVGTGHLYFLQSIYDTRLFINVFLRKRSHADNGVHGRTDVMRHIAEEGLFGCICVHGLSQFYLQLFLFRFQGCNSFPQVFLTFLIFTLQCRDRRPEFLHRPVMDVLCCLCSQVEF